jgi:beta-N-acetylhexosaminidase
VVAHDPARLQAIELAPFAAAAAARAEAIMTAHVMFPALDPQRPATLSPVLLDGVLRRQLGFTGLVVSDDLGMKAVADRWPIEELVVESLLAGADHFLIREPATRQMAAWEALVKAAEARSEVKARVLESAGRVAAFKALSRLGLPEPDGLEGRVGTEEHRALAASFERVSATGNEASPVGN